MVLVPGFLDVQKRVVGDLLAAPQRKQVRVLIKDFVNTEDTSITDMDTLACHVFLRADAGRVEEEVLAKENEGEEEALAKEKEEVQVSTKEEEVV